MKLNTKLMKYLVIFMLFGSFILVGYLGIALLMWNFKWLLLIPDVMEAGFGFIWLIFLAILMTRTFSPIVMKQIKQ